MENINFKFDITISKEGYTSKETTKRNYTPSDWNVINTDLDTFSSYIKSGYTSCYIFKGNNRKKDNFVKTNIIFFDLDYMPVDFDSFISSVELKPSYAYTSYSYNEDNKIYKYRLIYLLDKEVTSIDEFNNIYYSIAKTIGISDLNAFDNRVVNQYYFGTNSSNSNFKEYISYNVYNTNDFLSNNSKVSNYPNIDSIAIGYNNIHNIEYNQNDTLKKEVIYHSDYIESGNEFYSYYPDEYYAIPYFYKPIKNGSRTKTLYAVGHLFKKLNKDITEKQLYKFLKNYCDRFCENETDIITEKDLLSLSKNILNNEFKGKCSNHGKIKVNMKECQQALQQTDNYNFTTIDCVNFARKQNTNDEILGNYDFTTSISENIKNLKALGINTTYKTIKAVMERTGNADTFDLRQFILEQIDINPSIKQKNIIDILQDKVSQITVKRMFAKLQEENIIINKGTKKEPLWKKC